MEGIYKVIINSIVSFIIMFIIAKIMGKRQIAQLEFIDYIVGISIGSIAAQMTFDVEIPFYYFIIGMIIYMTLALLVNLIAIRPTFLKAFLKGKPLILIENGKINYKNLHKGKLDINDLLALCRNKGYFYLNDVAYAILETDGEISILPNSEQTPTVVSDFNIQNDIAKLEIHLVIDGKISKNGLKEINKNMDWLKSKLNVNNKKEIKNICLAIYDENTENITIYHKNEIII